jgi:hypothetical protein
VTDAAATQTTATKCPHVPPSEAQRWAPIACDFCLGYVDRDGTVMSADVARQRHPDFAAIMDRTEPRYRALRQPQPQPSTRKSITRGSWTVAKFSGNLLILLVVLPVLAVLVFFTVTMLKLAVGGG